MRKKKLNFFRLDSTWYRCIIILLNLTSMYYKLINQKINVAYGLDNGYTYPTLVSITSILENSDSHSYYLFYLLVDKNSFNEENKKIFRNLEKKYDRCEIIILEISGEKFSKANLERYPMATYYRLLLADLIPDANRIIYLDGDTLIYSDLSDMYNLDMKDNIILGFVDNSFKKAQEFGIRTYRYVTAGVLLINLKKIRKDNYTQKFFEFIDKNQNKLTQEDQTVINIVLHGKIDLLPPEYGIWNFNNKDKLLYHNNYNSKNSRIRAYNEKDVIKAWKFPNILHFVRAKPWKKKTKHTHNRFHGDWWFYAKKTDEYEKILSFYDVKE